ncbi:NAD-dependent histone deacetylase sir2 [Rhodotorula kratochvilovae]
MDPAELESARVEPVDPSELAPPGPVLAPFPAPVPNYQELTDESPDEGSEDWDAIVAAAEAAFSEQDIDEMHHFLKERGLFAFLKEYLERRSISPSTLLLAFGVMVRPDSSLTDQLRMLKVACSRVLRNREKLEEYNTPQDVVELIRRSKRIVILTGAGVSTSCGIPDFRSPTGLYARLQVENNYDLDDPQDMFDLAYFKQKPYVFYSFAKEIYPSAFVPSPSHRFVRLLEMEDKLLRNYTQNIDGLFEQVGVTRMLNCHGSFATASCLLCKRRFPGAAIEADVFASRVPLCPVCTPELDALEAERVREKAEERPRKRKKVAGREAWEEEGESGEDDADEGRSEWEGKALVKPDIVFFGEALSDEFDHRLLEDREEVDLLIVMGTSLRVSPVAQLPSHLPHSVPQILINRDPVGHHQFDVCLLGDGDGVVRWLCEALARAETAGGKSRPGAEAQGTGRWDLDARVPVQLPVHATNGVPAPAPAPAEELPSLPASAHPPLSAAAEVEPECVGASHVWLFPGANREARWVRAVRQAYESDSERGEGEGQGEGEDAAVELPASLAPGEREGEPSDGPDGVSGEEDGEDESGEASEEMPQERV